MIHAELLINGFLIGGPCDGSIGKEVVRNPYDGSVVGSAAEGGFAELRTCIDAADMAFQTWRSSRPHERAALLSRIANLVEDRKEELADLLVREIGKPIDLARGEVDRTAVTSYTAAHEAEALRDIPVPLTHDIRGGAYSASVRRAPRGVVFGIVPYNWPYNLTAHKVAPAIAAGSTIVIKPSPLAPISTLSLLRLIHDAGCPAGVVNGWNGAVPAVSRAIADPKVKTISFTGSDAVGWALKERYWDRHVVLECGGDATAIVFPDADLETATKRIAVGAFAYAGQICISVQHVLVHRSIADEFLTLLREQTASLGVGDPSVAGVVSGPMISVDAAKKIIELIEDAKRVGGRVLVGGERTSTMVKPTILTDVPSVARVRNEEAFGPVLVVTVFDRREEAWSFVNQSKFGIHAGVFTDDPRLQAEAADQLEVGGVVVNDVPTVRFDALPYGGERRSGFGREGVRWAMEEFTYPKSIVERR